MAPLTQKISASSLVEVTVGMVLISLVIGFALMIYTNVSASATSSQHLKYQLLLREVARETVQQQTFSSETWQDEPVTIHKTVTPYPGTEGGWAIELEAVRSDERVIATYQTIVYAPSY